MGFIAKIKESVKKLFQTDSKEAAKDSKNANGIIIKELNKEQFESKHSPKQKKSEKSAVDKNSTKKHGAAKKASTVANTEKKSTNRPSGPKGKTTTASSPKKKELGTREPIKRDTDRKESYKSENKAPRAPIKFVSMDDFIPEEWDSSVFNPPVVEGKIPFTEVDLPKTVLRGVYETGYHHCTQIQAEILPHAFKGADVTGRAQTGTGKTAAFLLTILRHISVNKATQPRKPGTPRAVIMAPTRELVMQIEKDAKALSYFTGAQVLAVFGGMDYEKQKACLEDVVIDIIIATPGRLLDYYEKKILKLNKVEILVLDEADRMLDMGFLPDMRKIINATPPKSERQTMLFSATLTPEISRLASLWTNEPITVEIEPEQITSANIEQIAYIVSESEKFTLLYNLLKFTNIDKAIIFANRRDEVAKLTEMLKLSGITCDMLTGDVSQTKRIKTLESLRNGAISVLTATDVAARGIHVDGIDYVFNYTLPNDPEDYVHRIGRTGRAGAKGISISFATEEDAYTLPKIEEYIKESLQYITPDQPLLLPIPAELKSKLDAVRTKRKHDNRGVGGKSFGGRPPRKDDNYKTKRQPKYDKNKNK